MSEADPETSLPSQPFSSDIVARFDPAGRHVYVSPSVLGATGLAAPDWLGRTHRELGYPEPFCVMWETAIGQVFASGQETETQFEFEGPHGLRFYHVLLVPERDRAGRVRHVFAVARNLTALWCDRLALAESRRTLSTLIGNLPGVAYRCANVREWTFEFISEGALALTGYPASEFLPPTSRAFGALIHPADRDRVWETIQRALAARRPFELTYRLHARSGEEKVVWERGLGVFDAGGRVLALEGFIQDVTERERAVERLAEREALLARRTAALERALDIDRLKSQFVSSVSHELRTPLTSIQGYTEFLEDEVAGPLTATQGEYLAEIAASTRRLTRLVDDLLDFSRLEAGTFALRLEEVDLRPRLEEAARSFRPQAKEANVQLNLALPETPLRLVCDPARVAQVVLNLLSNAIKFTPPGRAIGLRAELTPEGFYCAVSDTGPGIAEADLARLFRRFSQLDASNTRSAGGVGLGLSICKAIVEAHGGTIGVESTPGTGSSFWFRLPLRPLPAAQDEIGS